MPLGAEHKPVRIDNPIEQADELYDREQRWVWWDAKYRRRQKRKQFYEKVRVFLWRKP